VPARRLAEGETRHQRSRFGHDDSLLRRKN
jgi:hypothetical protein